MEKDNIWHIRQGDAGRFEEYVTLREEMLELFRFCRQVLYWTVVLVVAGLTWQIGNLYSRMLPGQQGAQQGFGLPNAIFAIILLTVILLSFLVHFSYLLQIYNVGGFIAFFWESSDNERGLKWHRFSRNFWKYWPKPRPKEKTDGTNDTSKIIIWGMMNISTLAIYTISAIVSVGILHYTKPSGEYFLLPWIYCVIVLIALFLSSHFLGKTMISMENAWRIIRYSETEQKNIHENYGPKNPAG